jgi:predicted GTPase
MDNNEFEKTFEKFYGEKVTDLDKHINIVVVGKVSSGKSSLINAILERDRFDPVIANSI